jgi:putative ABC transport system substrate-binding protein
MRHACDAGRRRTLRRWLAGAGIAIAGKQLAHAQAAAKPLPLVFILNPGHTAETSYWWPVLRQALAGLGWIEGRTVHFELRHGDHRPERIAALAREAIASNPALIWTAGPPPMILPVTRATASIPIVLGISGDVVSGGLATSLAHPGGNVTGMTLLVGELNGKLLESLKEVVPSLRNVGLLTNAVIPIAALERLLGEPARSLGLGLRIEAVSRVEQIGAALEALKRNGAEALVVENEPLLDQAMGEIAARSLAVRLPCISQAPGFAEAGGLLEFGADMAAMVRQSAAHIDRILRGAKPGDLPFEQPTRFVFLANAKTARELGLTLPPSILVRLDRVVE